jgi:UDP-glucose 4-epimerase
MRMLVTGGAGFIGSHLVDALVAQDHQVSIIDDLSHGTEKNINQKAKLYKMDICSESLSSIFSDINPEIVFHLAARTSVNHSMADPIAVEHYLQLYSLNWGLDFLILRYPNVYGPRQDHNGEAGVISIFARHMCRGEPVYINGSGLQERDFVYVEDIVRANLSLLGCSGGRLYNLSSGGSISIKALFEIMKSLTGYRREPIFRPPLPGEILRIYLSTTRIGKEIGWRPRIKLVEGLHRTIDYHNTMITDKE